MELPWECEKWSKTQNQQCCSCSTSPDVVCTQSCPNGFYEKGRFSIKDGQPSDCLEIIQRHVKESENFEKRAVLCGHCHASCARCNGPTGSHCKECSSSSYRDVHDEISTAELGADRIISSSLLLPDGNVVVFKKPSTRNIRRRRMSHNNTGKIIGKSVSWNSSSGFSGVIHWKVGQVKIPEALRKQKVSLTRSRSRRRRFLGRKTTTTTNMTSSVGVTDLSSTEAATTIIQSTTVPSENITDSTTEENDAGKGSENTTEVAHTTKTTTEMTKLEISSRQTTTQMTPRITSLGTSTSETKTTEVSIFHQQLPKTISARFFWGHPIFQSAARVSVSAAECYAINLRVRVEEGQLCMCKGVLRAYMW